LNGKLLEHYGYEEELRNKLYHIPTIPDLEEVKFTDVQKFVPYIFDDLNYDKGILIETLNVFTFEQIIGYLETSVDLGILNMKYIKIKYNL
jgi:hypothetical protein